MARPKRTAEQWAAWVNLPEQQYIIANYRKLSQSQLKNRLKELGEIGNMAIYCPSLFYPLNR